ncbi:putative dynein, axonemal, heavy polypeptide 1, partial [Operophtera brumata]
MGPPGGGRNPISMRLMRHFHYISFTEMEYNSKFGIFKTILLSWTRDFEKVTIRETPFLKASLDIFNSLVEELLPTPAKSHYTFNLRDLSKVFQGMLMMDAKYVKNPVDVVGGRMMLFGDFMDVGAEDRKYIELNDREQLVLFEDAAGHLCRVARIVRQPMANALLLGMGGSDYNLSTTVPLQLVLCRVARIVRQPMANALLLGMGGSDYNLSTTVPLQLVLCRVARIVRQPMAKALLLGMGGSEDLDKIYMSVRHAVMEMNLPATKTNLFACYQRRVRANLHIVVVMSPIGEFPSLVNCCTIDWFSEWPRAALQSVATHFFTNMDDLVTTDEVIEAMVTVCCFVHQNVVDASTKFLARLNRLNYVTPMSYMEMLGAYAD